MRFTWCVARGICWLSFKRTSSKCLYGRWFLRCTQVGDLIYLAQERDDKRYIVVGPWVVLNRLDQAVALSMRDRDEVAKMERGERRRGSRPNLEYIVLRQFGELRAARAVNTRRLPAIGIPFAVGEPGAWLDRLNDPAEPVLDEIREERRAADAAEILEMAPAIRASSWRWDTSTTRTPIELAGRRLGLSRHAGTLSTTGYAFGMFARVSRRHRPPTVTAGT